MNEKKKANNKQQPVHEIHAGTVTASVYVFQTNTGYPYYAYELSRNWKSLTTGKATQGNSFFEDNAESLIEVVTRVSEWLRMKAQAGTPGEASEEQPTDPR